jgi:hypothetical protein
MAGAPSSTLSINGSVGPSAPYMQGRHRYLGRRPKPGRRLLRENPYQSRLLSQPPTALARLRFKRIYRGVGRTGMKPKARPTCVCAASASTTRRSSSAARPWRRPTTGARTAKSVSAQSTPMSSLSAIPTATASVGSSRRERPTGKNATNGTRS